MNFKKLLDLLEKGEDVMDPLSGIIGGASGILNVLGIGRKRQIRQQKEMAENAAKINYKTRESRLIFHTPIVTGKRSEERRVGKEC